MKIKELIRKTPEMTEEKLLTIITKHQSFLPKYVIDRLNELHKGIDINQAILDEWDLINDKLSYLTKGQRDKICSLVSVSLIEMVKDDESVKKEA